MRRLRLAGPAICPQPFQVHGVHYFSLQSIPLLSRKVGYTVLEFWPAKESSDYRDGVDHAENKARVYASVLEALPSEPAVGQASLHSSVEAFRLRPQSLVDHAQMLRTLHVNASLHRKHAGRVLTSLQTPPRDDAAYLPRFQGIKDLLRLKLAVTSHQLNFDVLANQPVQRGSTSFFSLTLAGASTWPSGKPSTSTRKSDW